MKSLAKKMLIIIAVINAAGFIGYKGFYARVYNQSNTPQDYEIGANISAMTTESTMQDMYDLPNRFAGTKSNAKAVQYIRNYFRETGLEPY